MSFKLHIFTHDQDNVQIPSKVSIIVYNMYLEASEMCVWGVTTSLIQRAEASRGKMFYNELGDHVSRVSQS